MEKRIPFSNAICDVPAIASQFVQPNRTAFEESVQLRSAKEILDAKKLGLPKGYL